MSATKRNAHFYRTRRDSRISLETQQELLIDLEVHELDTGRVLRTDKYGAIGTLHRSSCRNKLSYYKGLKSSDPEEYWKLYARALDSTANDSPSNRKPAGKTKSSEDKEEDEEDEAVEDEEPAIEEKRVVKKGSPTRTLLRTPPRVQPRRSSRLKRTPVEQQPTDTMEHDPKDSIPKYKGAYRIAPLPGASALL